MSLRYKNPVWAGCFADPFGLQWGDGYHAYGTGESIVRERDGSVAVFEALWSCGLVQWKKLGFALSLPGEAAANDYWAPESAASDGRFLFYYSSALKGCRSRRRGDVVSP